MNKTGRIIKGVGGIYTVFAENRLYQCIPRGLFRNTGETPLVGDYVAITVMNGEKSEASLHTIFPRKNSLVRPLAANIDQVIVTVSTKEPAFNAGLLDRFLVLISDADIETVICVNKSAQEGHKTANRLQSAQPAYIYNSLFEPYVTAGYTVVFTDALSGFGLHELKNQMKGKLNLFAGPSGVGKSSLINALNPALSLETGVLSKKTSRGKHTTRHTEIFPLGSTAGDGYCFDTPGFTALDFSKISKEKLGYLFREFLPFISNCKYANCWHVKEENCAVKDQIGTKIHKLRYESYVKILEGL